MLDRVIMHCDMNAFFASVEQQSNPDLQGKPIGVIGSSGRTVITTSSYEARAFGVKTGMNVWEARQVCPQIILVVGDNRKYTYTSQQIFRIMLEYTPLVEVFSIDEAWLDVTHSLSIFGSAERIAYLLKARIKHRFGITCSIGIASNKLLAKLGSDMKKPDGLTVIAPDRVNVLMESLPIKELCGIGRNMERSLNIMSIYTCGELGRCSLERLTGKFGVIGERLQQMGRGIDNSPIMALEDEQDVKSVGHSMTLKRDISDRRDIERYLLQLSEMVGRRARRYRVAGKTIHLTVRFADFKTVGK
jgi:DNA polymerase-4